jgi:predicted DNA-binding transcriptional regulator AlpA
MNRQEPLVPLLLDERAAAALLGLTPRCLQSWRHRGSGPKFCRISARCVRYRPADLAAWAEARLRTSTSDREGDGAA